MVSNVSISMYPAPADYNIRLVRPLRMIDIGMFGLWTKDVASAYEAELRAKLAELGSSVKLGEHLSLVDLSGFAVQTQEIASRLHLLAGDSSIRPKRAAVVNPTALLGSQVKRIAPDYCVFGDRAIALKWLQEGA